MSTATKKNTTTASVSEKSTKLASTKVVDAPVSAKVVEAPVKSVEAPTKSVDSGDAPAKKAPVKKAKAVEVVAPAEETSTVASSTTPAPSTPAASESAPATVEGDGTQSFTEDVFSTKFTELISRLAAFTNDLRDINAQVRSLQKEHNRFVRENTKRNAKRLRTTKRTASGFAKPTLLSDEMYNFLGIEKGTLVVRNDATKKLFDYVKANNLRNEEDKRIIMLNPTLRSLLNVPEGDSLTYFNIQKYIKHHFVKPVTA
jgi:hypothetical protein